MTPHWAYTFGKMAFSKATRARVLASFIIATVVAVLGLGLRTPEGLVGGNLQRASYDALHAGSGATFSATEKSPVVIVYLDLKSFNDRGLDPAKAWQRPPAFASPANGSRRWIRR